MPPAACSYVEFQRKQRMVVRLHREALQQLVQGGMLHLKAALAEAARAEVNPLRKSAAPAREAFFCCFSAFAAATDSLATSLLVQQLGGTGATQVRGQRACCLLLGCCSPCCAVCLHA